MIEFLLYLALYLCTSVGVGTCILQALKIDQTESLERFFASSVVGMLASTLFAFFTALLWPPLFLALLPIGWWGLWGLMRGKGPTTPELVIAAAAFLGVLRMASTYPYLETVKEGVVFTSYYDHLLHSSWVYELLRGIPPVEMPHVAGESFWPYHLFTDIFVTTVVRFTGAEPLFAQQFLFYPTLWLLMGLGIGIFIRRLTASPFLAVLAIAIYFLPLGMGHDSIMDISRNSPQLFGMVSLAAACVFLSRYVSGQHAGDLILMGFCVGGVFVTKANLFLFVAMGFVFVLVHLLFLKVSFKTIFLSGIATCVLVIPMLTLIQLNTMPRSVGFSYGAFAGWTALHQPGPLPLALIEASPMAAIISWALRYTAWLTPFLILFVVGWVLKRKRFGLYESFGAGLLLGWFLVCLFPVETGRAQFEAWNIAIFSQAAIRFFAIIMAVVSLYWLGKGVAAKLDAKIARLALVSLMFLHTSFALQSSVAGSVEGKLLLPSGWLEANEFVRTTSAQDAVVVAHQPLFAGTFLSTFTGRRVVVERVVLTSIFYESVYERMVDVITLYSTDKPAAFFDAADRWGVDYILEDLGSRPLQISDKTGLELVFEGPIRVWKVDAATKPKGEPPTTDNDRKRRIEIVRGALSTMQKTPPAKAAAKLGITQAELKSYIDAVKAMAPLQL